MILLFEGEGLNLETLQASMRREELSTGRCIGPIGQFDPLSVDPFRVMSGQVFERVARDISHGPNETGLDLLILGRIGQLERDSG